jgi:predicted flap endonuclease-1-like 5' DNA nuclease
MTNATPAPTGGAIASMAGVTTTTLILIAIGAVVVIALMFFGAHLKRRRKAAEQELRASADTVAGPGPITEQDAVPTPATTETHVDRRVPEERSSHVGEQTQSHSDPIVRDAPVAPAPPPLAGDDTPVVAAAPFDASPASVAADLATPPPASPSDEADDLTVMKGVGPRLAVRLGELGVVRYADLADLSPEQADALDAQLGSFRGRLTRDRWIEQAGYLARGDRAGFEAAFGKL